MQVNNRSYYGEDSLMAAVKDGVNLPEVTKMKTAKEFNAGGIDEVWL